MSQTKSIKPKIHIPTDSKWCKLPLAGGFVLTLDTLKQYYQPLPNSLKALSGLDVNFICIENELVEVYVTLREEKPHRLLIHISEGEMEISCDCGRTADHLCDHAYCGLRYIMFYKQQKDFVGWYWPGSTTAFNDGNSISKYLEVKVTRDDITVRAKVRYGDLYRPGVGFNGLRQLKLEKQPNSFFNTKATVHQKEKQVIGYFLAYNPRNHPRAHLPFLLPFIGIADDAGEKIKQFKAFVKGDVPEDILLTATQQSLNEIGEAMFLLLRETMLQSPVSQELGQEIKNKLFGMWQQAYDAGLANERFIYAYDTGHLKMLYGKPPKYAIKVCRLVQRSPLLSFLLSDKGDYFSLSVLLMLDGKQVKIKADKIPLFTTDDAGLIYYPVVSVQDDDLLNWLCDHGNRVTILKKHFIAFHDQFLVRLNECYPVSYLARKSRKLVPFNFDLILKDLDIPTHY